MTGDTDDIPRFVCHGCIGDAFLKEEVKREGKRHTCTICGSRKKSIAFDELCDRVHMIVSEEFQVTDSEPESWTPYKEGNVDWERDGQTVDELLAEVLECNQPLIDAIKEELSGQHHSFDDAAAGIEDPYGDEVQYELRKADDYEFHDAWSQFESEIRTQARFFSSNAESALDEIFGELDRFTTFKRPFIRVAGPGTSTEVVYRGRRAFDNSEIRRMVEHPARELGAPPSRSAASGRMNPRWISMFYGAFDPDTCVSEIRAPVGSAVVIGKFIIIRKLRLLDLDALQHVFVKRASYFDPSFRRLREKAEFLKRLVVIMSRPVLPTDEDFHYLPTQAVAEYLSEKMEPRLDGLIFRSSQRGGEGENVVLFRRASGVEPDGTDSLSMRTNFGWTTEDDADTDITIWMKKKRKPRAKKTVRSDFLSFRDDWLDDTESAKGGFSFDSNEAEEPALRIDLNKIEVRDIVAVKYTTLRRFVRRYKEPRGKSPF
jgi:hypothetical protein